MSERIVELPVQVAPERVRKRLTDLSAGRDRLREDGLGVGDVEGEDDRCAADRRCREHAELGELVGQMHEAVADAQLDRHQPPVGRGDPAELLGAEGVAVEGGSALGALNDDVRSDLHRASVPSRHSVVLHVLAVCSLARWRPIACGCGAPPMRTASC